jgi:2,4-dienoyl-CoA reductase-like NADH-dependent reductase (Old Yellow Enzyme family)
VPAPYTTIPGVLSWRRIEILGELSAAPDQEPWPDMSSALNAPLFAAGRLGPLHTRNRLIRAGTSETMAGPGGEVTDALVALYGRLAQAAVGTIFTGHLYCHERGKYLRRQAGIYDDRLTGGLRRLADTVHTAGGLVLGQIAHAGSQSRVPDARPIAPSDVPNALTGRPVPAASEEEIAEAVRAFAAGARRAVEAGFDGVHIHGANGYLISEFLSPLTNRRADEWGGDAERRSRFLMEVIRAVRRVVPSDRALTIKLGLVDAPPDGLGLGQSVPLAARAIEAGVDAVEVSCGVMVRIGDSAREYVAVDRRRAVEDLLLQRVLSQPAEEAYFLPWARALRARVNTTTVAVGGLRRTETMCLVLESGDADFIAMARPYIREPDLAAQLARGRTGRVDCTSCNLCLRHEGHHSMRCWRMPRRRLVQHAIYRAGGGFRRDLPGD